MLHIGTYRVDGPACLLGIGHYAGNLCRHIVALRNLGNALFPAVQRT